MYQLYCARDTYAMGVHALLEELGVDYELREVTLYSDAPPADFLAASPHGRVPALRHRHGTVFESGAIALYLTDTHGDQGFGVALDHPERGRFLQWLVYLSSELQKEVMLQFHPDRYFSDPAQQAQLQAASMQRLAAVWHFIDQAYGDRQWLIDGRPTAVDYCLSVPLQWPECFVGDVQQYPNLARLLEALLARPGYRRAVQWHQQTAAE